MTRFPISTGLAALLLCISWWLARPAWADEPFRVGVIRSNFVGVNQNDAIASMKIWGNTFIQQRNLHLQTEVRLFERLADLQSAARQVDVHAMLLTAQEYLDLGIRPDSVFIQRASSGAPLRYVLLVRRDEGVSDIQSLAGQRVALAEEVRMNMAELWLKSLLHRGAPKIKPIAPNKAVLEVFFRQSKAALVSEESFALASELNPQLRRDLVVLKESPPFVSMLLIFVPNWQTASRAQLEAAILNLHTNIAGQQILTLFQGARMERHPASIMDETLAFLNQYRRDRGSQR